METIIYKGVEIVKVHNACYVFYLNNTKHTNTNLHFAKVMISKNLKN